MKKLLFEENITNDLEDVDLEEELGQPVVNNDPSQDDRICSCCRRSVSELEPFDKMDDELNGDIEDVLLINTLRLDCPVFTEPDIIHSVFWRITEQHEECERRLIEEFGEEDAGFIMINTFYPGQVCSVTLCKDCIMLDDDDYYNKTFEASDNKGLTIQEMRTLAQSLLEKCRQKHPFLCSQVEEEEAKARAARIL